MTLVSRVVFVVLVGATFAAFFAAQRLKGAPPVVRVTKVAKFFSPNGDGARDRDEIHIRLKKADDVTVSVVARNGDEIRRLASNVRAQPYRPLSLSWDGRTDAGSVAPDGLYRVRISLRHEGRSVTVQEQMILDTTPPKPVVTAVTPAVTGSAPAPFRASLQHVSRRYPTALEVVRTDSGRPRTIATFQANRGDRTAEWTPSDPLAPGTYMIVAKVRDRAGNVGASATLPPAPGEIAGHPGFTVRALAAQAPDEPVRAGQRLEFYVDARGRSYRWRVRRLGAARPIKRGTARDARLVMSAPNGISGVYLLELRHGRDTARVPFLVQSNQRSPLLVVLPVITWLGTDQVDDDRDGVPNTLENGGPVAHPRVLQGGVDQLPAGFADQVAPLLVYLDRNHLRYDLTSDLALALDGARDPRATDRDGVLLAGPLRWVPPRVARRLRRYVLDGGRLASFGAGSLRRSVSVGRTRLMRPTQPTPADPFGARLEPVRREQAAQPLTVLDQRSQEPLLTGTDGSLDGFDVLEESDNRGTRVLTALGREPTDAERSRAEAAGQPPPEARPALTASRLGKGSVIRIGLPQWGQRIAEDPEVAQITHNIVDILRGVAPRTRSAR